MRTTLTIDDDVAFSLKLAQESDPDKSFKEIVNDALRLGLGNRSTRSEKKRFKVKPMDLGLRSDIDWNNIEEALEILEGPNRL